MQEQQLLQRAAQIRLAVFDVDGVLTDGRLYYGADGEQLKVFHSRDGLALKALARSDINVGIISGRDHPAVNVRMAQLGIARVHQGIEHKLPVLQAMLDELGLEPQQMCFMGDDWNDAPAMRHAGLALAPADAAGAVRHLAHYVTRSNGGCGAAREACELLLGAHQQLHVLETIGQ
ncbi:MAG: HAD family hydrolase [Wenzhouxiangellaceae bacterium]